MHRNFEREKETEGEQAKYSCCNMATIAAKISTRGLAKYVGKCVVCFAWSTRARATKIAAKLSWARRELGHPLLQLQLLLQQRVATIENCRLV